MPEELTRFQKEEIDKIYRSVEKDLVKGYSSETIAIKLVKKGWPQESAIEIINNIKNGIESPEWRQSMASRFKRHMLYGALWAIGGGIVTIITYSVANAIGGIYVVAWGAILWGLIDFLRGLIGWLKFRNYS